jgi:hypothetical protein
MSEFHFGVGNGRVNSGTARRIDKIAAKHDATFVAVTLPGNGPRYWFSCANLGHPFDGAIRDAVIADLTTAGLWPIPTVRA